MPAEYPPTLRSAARLLAGTRPSPLPPQPGFWNRVRAALAFQPAYPVSPPPDASETRRAIAALPAGTRLKARSNPILTAASLSANVAQSISPLVSRARAFADALARLFDGAGSAAVPLALARNLDRDLALAHHLARDLAFVRHLDLDLDLARILNRARRLTRDLARDFAFTRRLVRALDPADYLPLNPAVALDSARRLVRDLARELDRARELARDLDRRAAQVLGLDSENAQGLGAVLAAGGLDDFTDADLSSTDLTGIGLDGVYWSTWGTQWPPGFDVERLKTESRKVDVGVYVVEGAGASTSDVPSLVS